jgi:hypothetical protein
LSLKNDYVSDEVVLMNCRRVRSQLAALSAEQLSARSISALHDHLAKCPQCQQEWLSFQQTVLLLSTTSQPILRHEQSQKMWGTCAERLYQSIEQRRLSAQRPSLWNWARQQPRWGWAALGGAILILGGVWWATPQGDTGNIMLEQPTAPLSFAANGTPGTGASGTLVTFTKPPLTVSSAVDHHATMSFDPFVDHVGSSLVSYSATVPQQ